MSDAHVHRVQPAWKKNALIDNDTYLKWYADSVKSPDKFWGKHGKRIDWFKPFTKVKNTSFEGKVSIKWFEDGQTNVSYNCIDRHLKKRGNQVAIIWEGDNPYDEKKVTYNELHEHVCRWANVLKKHGVKKGDRVTVYMPMILEAAYAMFACTRLGAIHSVVFGGFSPDALAGRIVDCKSNFVITAKYVIVSVAGQLIVGFGMAMLLNRDIPFKGLLTTLLLLPMMLSMAVVGLFWKLLYDPSFGIINYALGLGTFEWLADPKMALYAVALTDIWMWSPFVMLLSLAGLSAVPKHLYEAAAIDRAGPFYTFFRITLPLVAPILMIAVIFRTMEAFKTFDLAYILTSQPTTELISIRLYKMAFQEWQTGRSCALAYIVLIMVLAITNIYVKYLNQVKER